MAKPYASGKNIPLRYSWKYQQVEFGGGGWDPQVLSELERSEPVQKMVREVKGGKEKVKKNRYPKRMIPLLGNKIWMSAQPDLLQERK